MEAEARTLKRKLKDGDQSFSLNAKRIFVDVFRSSKNNLTSKNVCFESLPDDVLLVLLSFLKATDLVNVSRCSSRLYRICCDKSLWQRVEVFCDGKELQHYCILPFLNLKTVSLQFVKEMAVESQHQNTVDTCFCNHFFQRLTSLKNLNRLSVENHILSTEQLMLKFLPENITKLNLHGTQLISVNDKQSDFFYNISQILPNLEHVDVSYCQWFIPYCLVILAKCKNLKVLRMIGCKNLKEFVPYAGVACYYGFPNLETLDMRLTNVVDCEVGCFNRIKSLKHILLERPPTNHNNESDPEMITDICTMALGRRNMEIRPTNTQAVEITVIPADGGNAFENTIETLVLRNYPRITDLTLKHAEKCLKSLKLLDVSGSSCSQEQVALFRANRPEVKLVYEISAL